MFRRHNLVQPPGIEPEPPVFQTGEHADQPFASCIIWCTRRVSNPRHVVLQTTALPAELPVQKFVYFVYRLEPLSALARLHHHFVAVYTDKSVSWKTSIASATGVPSVSSFNWRIPVMFYTEYFTTSRIERLLFFICHIHTYSLTVRNAYSPHTLCFHNARHALYFGADRENRTLIFDLASQCNNHYTIPAIWSPSPRLCWSVP